MATNVIQQGCRSCRFLDVPLNKGGKRVARADSGYWCTALVEVPPLPVSVVKNYKGGTYRYITDALLEWAPEHHVIIYESEADGSRWVRPRAEFYAWVDTPDGAVRRFLKINSNDEVIE